MNRCKKALAVLAIMILLIGTLPMTAAADGNIGTDYSELQLLIGTVNGLNYYDFTAETWAPLEKAVEKGNRYLKGKYGQQLVNEVILEIEWAMLELVRMDYSKLEASLASVYAKIDENPEMHDIWYRLDTAVEEARPLLVSGDQAAVNAAVEKLNKLLEEYASMPDAEGEPEIVIQEVEVEVPPSSDFCNIPMHRTWPALFALSLGLNVGLIAGLVYVIAKKRNTYDNTPLVSYDIDDDMDF